MSKFIEHSKSKMISSYGGVGSIVESIENSVLIESFDKWGYLNGDSLEDSIIQDDRLLSRLRIRFPNLMHILRVPEHKEDTEGQSRIYPTASYFPKWMYCGKCNRFENYESWLKRWIGSGKDIMQFYPPKCNNLNCKGNVLEQVRFLMTCPDGHLQDLPWQWWPTYASDDESEIEDAEGEDPNIFKNKIKLDFTNPAGCCDKPDLRYVISRENSELSGINVLCTNPKCTSPKKGRSLKGIFNFRTVCSGKRFWLSKEGAPESCKASLKDAKIKNAEAKVVIKSSNSVYYANTVSSIYIPIKQSNISPKDKLDIEDALKNNEDIPGPIKRRYSKEQLDFFIKHGDSENLPEKLYRQAEFSFLSTTQEYFEIPFLKFIKVKLDDKIPGISHVIRLDRLKQTSVQVSFTRQEPLDIDSVLLTDEETTEFAVKRQSISINNINTTIIPGVELYGEGLLFILDDNKLRNWSKHEEVLKRTKVIAQNTYSSDRKFLHAKHKEITAEFILIHTLSHLIIKELEYKCGYSTSSLQERLYIGEGMNGFMILAIEGSEGSLGGLVSQSDDLDNLNNLIQSALKRAEDCSSDPVCYNSDGQGVSNLNLAACHACTLLPETACEEFNVFLDRCLLIDQDYGYFNFERTKR